MMKKERYIDIHSHILPGVDDGAGSMEESLCMLRQAQEQGIGTIILTPHQKPERKCVTVSGLQRRILQLREEMENRHIDVQLYPGSECLYHHGLAKQLEQGEICTLAGSQYVLTEFMPDEDWQYIRNGLYGLVCEGYRPVIAHVERYIQLSAKLDRIQELIDMGCYIQINAGSVSGSFGFGMKRAVRRLLKEEMVHFVATDAHRGSGKRSVQLDACTAYLNKKCGTEYVNRLLWENAFCILENTEI